MNDILAALYRLTEMVWQRVDGENGIAILLLWATVLLTGIVT
jgi:hypothetical protein